MQEITCEEQLLNAIDNMFLWANSVLDNELQEVSALYVLHYEVEVYVVLIFCKGPNNIRVWDICQYLQLVKY